MDPDLPLIEALQTGDDSALNTLMAHHREPLFRFVFRYLRNETAARDVVQEVFVRAYFKAKTFVPKASVKTWLYAIALNLCRDEVRRLARHPLNSLDAPSPLSSRTSNELADGGVQPDEQATRSDRHHALQRAIDRLPEKLREPLILYALEGKTQQEVAEILGTTLKTVELRVYHAKTKLRSLLANTVGSSAV